MVVFPEFQDSFMNVNLKRGQLPFYITMNSVHQTHLHHHDFVELNFVINGQGTEMINGKKHMMRPGTFSFLLPHHMHEIQCKPGMQVQKYCCMFDINILLGSPYDSEFSNMLFKIGTEIPSFIDFSAEHAEKMEGILHTLHKDFLNPGSLGFNSLIRAKLIEGLLLFLRDSSQQVDRHEINTIHSNEKVNFWSILKYVHMHYHKKLTLEVLSRQFELSSPYISRSFKSNLGKTFTEYLHALRIESAASLLLSTEMTITEIAFEVGFDSFRTFSRVFREVQGQTPSDYRYMYATDLSLHPK